MKKKYSITNISEEIIKPIFARTTNNALFRDISFAPIDKHPAISTLTTTWTFVFCDLNASKLKSEAMKEALSVHTLQHFPFLSGRISGTKEPVMRVGEEDSGVLWRDIDVLWHGAMGDTKTSPYSRKIEQRLRVLKYVEKTGLGNPRIPKGHGMAIQKTNIRMQGRKEEDGEDGEDDVVLLTFSVRHYVADGESMRLFLDFFTSDLAHVLREENRKGVMLDLPTVERTSFFKVTNVNDKKTEDFIAIPDIVEHGCFNIKPTRAIWGVFVGALKILTTRTTRVKIHLTSAWIEKMKIRTSEREPIVDFIVDDDFVSTNDLATAFVWNLCASLKKKKKKEKKSFASIAINHRNYGTLPKHYFGNASFSHIVACDDDDNASVEKRAREVRRSLGTFREADPRFEEKKRKIQRAFAEFDNISFREHAVSFHCMLNKLDVIVSNWSTFGFFDYEFGNNVKASHLMPSVSPSKFNAAVIIPEINNDGCIVVVEIATSQIKKAKKLINEMLAI